MAITAAHKERRITTQVSNPLGARGLAVTLLVLLDSKDGGDGISYNLEW